MEDEIAIVSISPPRRVNQEIPEIPEFEEDLTDDLECQEKSHQDF